MINTNTTAPQRPHFGQRIIYTYEGQPIAAEVIGYGQRSLIVLNTKTPRYTRAISPARIIEIFND